jgi:hypothetical protein
MTDPRHSHDEFFVEDSGGDPATGIVISTIIVVAFGCGLFCGLFARAIWMMFSSFRIHQG